MPTIGPHLRLLRSQEFATSEPLPSSNSNEKAPSYFNCDGCGTDGWDTAYACSMCEFWIHSNCASLPETLETKGHHHLLTLAFSVPIQHRNFLYNCDVCLKELHTTFWVYYCGACRYFAHVKCATATADTASALESAILNITETAELIQLPVRDISKELLAPFIIRENGLNNIPDTNELPESITMPETTENFSLLFNYHKHPLGLVQEEDATDELIICDVCISPIYSTPYYHCPTCNKYFVHHTCSLLPKTLAFPNPLLNGDCPQTNANHRFTLCTGSELDNKSVVTCRLCLFETNGRVYRCDYCMMIIDIKCAALPIFIKHAAHKQHTLIMKRVQREECWVKVCGGCGDVFRDGSLVAYYCTRYDCDFVLEMKCVMIPQITKHEWEKHPLLLTYDASVDHPTDFYCEFCEGQLHPKKWMYHCRECDHSFHMMCIEDSDANRNVKSGRQVSFDHRVHPHPLTLNRVTLKFKCDACKKYWYKLGGFECEPCNYALCYPCGVAELGKM